MQNYELLEKLEINLKNKRYGSLKTQCPKCSQERKNKQDLCLSVNIDEGVYNCHHCSWKGKVFNKIPKKEFFTPPPRLEKLEKTTITWFENERKISNNTLLRFKVTDGTEWMPKNQAEVPVICFNYYREDKLVNTKFRAKGKDFKLIKNAELIFYNLDSIKNEERCYIVEGEIDALSLYEAGITSVVSVPNGASKGSQKLEYLDNCWKDFEGINEIVIFTDADEAGYVLREELARRLGMERCRKVEYPENCKDANEILIKYGKETLKNVCENISGFPIEGILTVADDLIDEIYQYWENGYPTGIETGIPNLDEHFTLMGGQFTIITGIPSSGKSEFLDFIVASVAKKHRWKFGVCSFENQPAALHATKLMEKIGGGSFAFRANKDHRLTQAAFEQSLLILNDHFTFVNIRKVDVTLDGILDKFTELVRQKGCKGFILDPWNYIEAAIPAGQTETQYISECLTKIRNFCLLNNAHLFLVAHPTKLKKEVNGKYEIPTMYSISGSAHFFNKTDNGIAIYRDFETGIVTAYIQKIRYSWLGKLGSVEFTFDTNTRQYTPVNYVPTIDVNKYHEPKKFDNEKETPF
jgi:twinkle protein